MEVAYRWALLLYHPQKLAQITETEHDRLISIITAIQDNCITNEFNYDRNIFRENMGRPPLQTEEPYVLQQFYTYNAERKRRLFDCIASVTRTSLEMNYNERVSVGLMLWSACIATSKILDNRRGYPEAQLTEIVNTFKERAEANAIHKTGQEIACLYMNKVNEGQFIDFGRFPANSAPRRHQKLCHQ